MKTLFVLPAGTLLNLSVHTSYAAGKPDALVDAARLNDPQFWEPEVRYPPHRHTNVGDIPGAVQVQGFADPGANDEMPNMGFPPRTALQATLRRSGVNDDSTVRRMTIP